MRNKSGFSVFNPSFNINEDPLAGQLISLRRGVALQVCYHPGSYPALVFLHGGLGNRFNWRCQYEFFAAQGRTVLAYDLGGHGQSNSYPRYSIGRHWRDLTRLLQNFLIQSPVLCCHSYGVPIGLEWARRYPVKGLVLVAGGTHALTPWWEIPLVKALKWGGRYLYHFPGVQSLTDWFSSSHSSKNIKQFLAESPVPKEVDPYKALEIFWRYNFFRKSSPEIDSHVPVLVITGGRDSMFSREMGEALANCFNLREHLHLPSGGHLMIAEYPDLVNTAIAEWLTKFEII
jgi:pimeloyl-ACP methyl ester carboxylesterase